MILSIDTTETGQHRIKIKERDGRSVAQIQSPAKEELLGQIELLLNDQKINKSQLEEIRVNPGPGVRFSQTRLGITIANALAFSLSVKVNGKKQISPIYHKKPKITQKTN